MPRSISFPQILPRFDLKGVSPIYIPTRYVITYFLYNKKCLLENIPLIINTHPLLSACERLKGIYKGLLSRSAPIRLDHATKYSAAACS